jgi:hypothetical protein
MKIQRLLWSSLLGAASLWVFPRIASAATYSLFNSSGAIMVSSGPTAANNACPLIFKQWNNQIFASYSSLCTVGWANWLFPGGSAVYVFPDSNGWVYAINDEGDLFYYNGFFPRWEAVSMPPTEGCVNAVANASAQGMAGHLFVLGCTKVSGTTDFHVYEYNGGSYTQLPNVQGVSLAAAGNDMFVVDSQHRIFHSTTSSHPHVWTQTGGLAKYVEATFNNFGVQPAKVIGTDGNVFIWNGSVWAFYASAPATLRYISGPYAVDTSNRIWIAN